jgi:hypothetical protein
LIFTFSYSKKSLSKIRLLQGWVVENRLTFSRIRSTIDRKYSNEIIRDFSSVNPSELFVVAGAGVGVEVWVGFGVLLAGGVYFFVLVGFGIGVEVAMVVLVGV